MKKSLSILVALLVMLTCPGLIAATQQPEPCLEFSEVEIKLSFDISSSRVNPDLDDNRQTLAEIDELLTTVINDSSWVVKRVSVRGSASPEGPVALNRRLSQRRADAISQYFAAYTDDASVPTDFHFAGANWDGMRALVLTQDGVPDRLEIVRIIDSGAPDRMARIKRLSGGATYRWLVDNLFPQLRVSAVTLALVRDCVPQVIRERLKLAQADTIQAEAAAPLFDTEVVVEEQEVAAPLEPRVPYVRNLYVKTNAVAWVMGITNIAFEVDLLPHLSITLPLYYSAWNYFTDKVKFRTCAFEPEVRGWLRPDNMGFFAGAHFGVAQYNMAIGGKYRYQDHNGHTPALGGGLSIGFRNKIGRSSRWMMEFTVGAGVYKLHYDVFDNSSVPYGYKVDERRKTFFGIDNVGITFIYSIPLRKEGAAAL